MSPYPTPFNSTDPWNSSNPAHHPSYEQFVAYFRILPALGNGKRREYLVSMESIASKIHAAFADAGLTIPESRPSVVPQFGQKTARVTLTGYQSLDASTGFSERPRHHPLENRVVDSNGSESGNGIRSGVGGNVQHGQDLTAVAIQAVTQLKQDIDAILTTELTGESITFYKLDFMGVTFGDGGIHFPA